MNKLPLTTYDQMKKRRPEMWSFIDKDLQALKQEGRTLPVFSIDDVGGGHIGDCFNYYQEKMLEEVAKETGLSIEDVLQNVEYSPELVQSLKLLAKSIEQDYHNYLNFELSDKKTLYFSDNLTDNLAATELEIDPALLRPPFDFCMYVFTAESIIQSAQKAFNRQTPTPWRGDGVLSVFIAYHSDRKTQKGEEFDSLLIAASYWEGKTPVFYIKREVALFPGRSIENALKTEWNDILEEEDQGKGIYISLDGNNDRTTEDVEFYTDGLHLFRTILNATLYLCSTDAEIKQRLSGREEALERADRIKSKAKAKKARYEAKRESALNFEVVGENVEAIMVLPHSRGTGMKRSSRNISAHYRYIVRGHWRNQAYGEGRKQRRLKWIKPFYKGPEMSDIVHKPYLVR